MISTTSNAVFNGEPVEVKIIDKSKRAYDISPQATKSLELALLKDRSGCAHCFTNIRATFYSLWLQLLKHHGKPPNRGSLSCLFFVYSLVVSLDILMSFVIFVHVMNPLENIYTFGIPWLFMLPFVTFLGPVWGFFGSFTASTTMLKTYSSFNATAFLMNIPLTLAYMIIYEEQLFYVVCLVILMINKIFISFFGSKVRQHLINPGYMKNEEKL